MTDRRSDKIPAKNPLGLSVTHRIDDSLEQYAAMARKAEAFEQLLDLLVQRLTLQKDIKANYRSKAVKKYEQTVALQASLQAIEDAIDSLVTRHCP